MSDQTPLELQKSVLTDEEIAKLLSSYFEAVSGFEVPTDEELTKTLRVTEELNKLPLNTPLEEVMELAEKLYRDMNPTH
jgi:hypothetical protein